MKKTISQKIFCILLSIYMFCLCGMPIYAKPRTPNLSFLAMSDLHLDDLLNQTDITNMEQFQMVLDQTGSLGLDLFVGGGDYSSYGNSNYWYRAANMVKKAGFDRSIWAIGNHEYGTTGLRLCTWSKFLSFANEKSLYYAKTINGCTFIVLGAESGVYNNFGYMSFVQKSWLAKTLKTAARNNKGKPIFVISHFDLATGEMEKVLTKELSKYDNVFLLWGHLHDKKCADMTYEQCFNDELGFMSARMGSVHYYNNDNADGLIVRVYDDRVELQMLRVSGKVLSPDTVVVKLKK